MIQRLLSLDIGFWILGSLVPAGGYDDGRRECHRLVSVVVESYPESPIVRPLGDDLNIAPWRGIRQWYGAHTRPMIAIENPGEPPGCTGTWIEGDQTPLIEIDFD
jgi:hypothetical protein